MCRSAGKLVFMGGQDVNQQWMDAVRMPADVVQKPDSEVGMVNHQRTIISRLQGTK
jgi:hypothetical protein